MQFLTHIIFLLNAAKNAQTTQAVEFNGSSEDLKLNVVYGAAHGMTTATASVKHLVPWAAA